MESAVFVIYITTLLSSAHADYACLCNYGNPVPIYDRPDNHSKLIGNLFDFDCKAAYAPDATRGFETIGVNNMFGYVRNGVNLSRTQCDGQIPEFEKVTTTTTPRKTTTTPTTTMPPTKTTTTTPAPPVILEGHTDLCPLFARNDVEKNHGNIQQYGDYCYEFVPYTTQWKNAETHCNIVSGGHLVSIMSQQEQDYVLRFLTRYKHVDPVWIGLSDGEAEGVFRWSSGEPVGYKHFLRTFSFHSSRDHALNDCIVLQSNGEWVDLPCGMPLLASLGFGEAHSFVCKYNLTLKPQSVLNGALGTLIG